MNKNFYLAKFGLCACVSACALLLNSCYPNGADNIEELDVVATVPKKDYNFKQNKTYTLPTRIPIVKDSKPSEADTLPAAVSQPILAEIRSQLSAYGYTEVVPGGAGVPDVAITTYALQTTYVGAYYPYWWDYWGYWPWGSWGYPWGPGWYPSGIYYYSYDTGSLLINISTPDGRAGEINTIWLGAVKGVLNGTTSNVQRATAGIDQAFQQSPYLKTN
ncbi:DUF4136 domain-containing protein [Solitalea canadensis]|uniref:DUF4136 domain-containing protein n=1 Tax=Solitalea canadensis (strain ATCC 29591 / DSM 3403 / JCM 21819 / LMG 8368 / NBRC 15130 / NCIMB 12057 / USAM 9D) TaxID=929556 RepID=H8KNY3_SOLCM|nr:DUF4136 domain-containing protein [Solitalea canadensis]AFD05394.1 hypothetical protein Solca_0249 [Solitalea canadensis DSM 3403]